jgi:hypothetical protein
MERLDPGHLHPKLEVPGQTCPGRESNPGGEHSEKEPIEQLVNSYMEHLLMSPRNNHNPFFRALLFIYF